MFVVTKTFVVFVQPFEGSVTVTVYVPDESTVGLGVVPPETIPVPVQLYVTPVVVELALMFPLLTTQVNVNDVPAVTFGKAPVFVTTTVVVAVHVFAGSVTVTV